MTAGGNKQTATLERHVALPWLSVCHPAHKDSTTSIHPAHSTWYLVLSA